jgi:hypothetical protein
MAAFDEIDYDRFDVWAVVECNGVTVVETAHRESCLAWLRREGYGVESIDFGQGIRAAVPQINEVFRWEEQFGYEFSSDRAPNLDALRDGFEFDLRPGDGKALVFHSAEVAYRKDRRWFLNLLAIAHEHSTEQLALGARFFTVLFLDEGSRLIGKRYEEVVVPRAYNTYPRLDDPFAGRPKIPSGS